MCSPFCFISQTCGVTGPVGGLQRGTLRYMKERAVDLHEYQAKRLFGEHGVPIPDGKVAYSPTEARDIAQDLGGKVVV